jgi:hypothetical protein
LVLFIGLVVILVILVSINGTERNCTCLMRRYELNKTHIYTYTISSVNCSYTCQAMNGSEYIYPRLLGSNHP